MPNLGQGRIVVTAIGALSPVGGNAEQTTATVSAGIAAFTEYPYLYCTPQDPEWDEDLPMYVAAVPAINPVVSGLERYIQLAVPAITEVISKAKLNRQSLAKTGLLVALPQLNEATIQLGLESLWLPQLCKRTGLTMKMSNACIEGRVGVLSQIAKAIPLLESGVLEQCIVGGVDTHLMIEHLTLLDKYWRLKSGRNVDGFVPGEASVMLMLETEEHAKARGAVPLALISGVGESQEPEIFSSEKVSTGQGLAAAIRRAVSEKTTDHQIQNMYCDFNGESYYAFELGLIMSRLGALLSSAGEMQHPADCYGDVGSASGGLLIACAIDKFIKQPKTHQNALIWAATDNGRRMALVLESMCE